MFLGAVAPGRVEIDVLDALGVAVVDPFPGDVVDGVVACVMVGIPRSDLGDLFGRRLPVLRWQGGGG